MFRLTCKYSTHHTSGRASEKYAPGREAQAKTRGKARLTVSHTRTGNGGSDGYTARDTAFIPSCAMHTFGSTQGESRNDALMGLIRSGFGSAQETGGCDAVSRAAQHKPTS